jgi:hypothetical protein
LPEKYSFRVVDVCHLTNNILSEATYNFQNHCAMKCLQYPFCAGYNFKKKHQKKTSNCQLTHTVDHNFHDCNADDKGGIFYHPVAPRKVQNCSKNILNKLCPNWFIYTQQAMPKHASNTHSLE